MAGIGTSIKAIFIQVVYEGVPYRLNTSCPAVMSTTYIDDQDLSKVVYNGTWVEGGTPHEYNNTVSSSTNVGDSFTVTFQGIMHVFF